MRTETNLYDGTTLVLETPADLREAPKAVVPPRLRALFRDFPRSFRLLAATTAYAPLATWLRRQARTGHAVLRIERPGRGFDDRPQAEAFLEVGPDDDRVLLSGPLGRIPKRCPEPLAEVLRTIGTVRVQYGAAGALLAPAEQRPFADVASEIAQGWGVTEEAANIPRPKAPATHFTFFENACGSLMTTNAAGETWHLPMAGGAYVAGPPIATWLRRFFRPGFVWT